MTDYTEKETVTISLERYDYLVAYANRVPELIKQISSFTEQVNIVAFNILLDCVASRNFQAKPTSEHIADFIQKLNASDYTKNEYGINGNKLIIVKKDVNRD